MSKQHGAARRVWQPLGLGALVIATMVALYSFAPTQALARDLLGIFRVRKFAVIRLDPGQTDQVEAMAEQLEEALFVEEPEVVADEPDVQVANLDEARELAGFDVAMPQYTGDEAIETYNVKGQFALRMAVDRDALVTVLTLAGMDGEDIPADFEGGDVEASFRSSVQMAATSWSLIQVWQPYAEYPTGFDPALVGEAGFRLMGIPEREARQLAERIDWANTLIVPVPSDIMRVTEMEIAGSPALLMAASNSDSETGGLQKLLIWQRGDVLYALSAEGLGDERIVKIAESLF